MALPARRRGHAPLHPVDEVAERRVRVRLDELRLVRTHEELEERITHFLEAGTVAQLFQRILARWETDYDGRTNLVRNAMTLFWAARRGLSESEIS